jgi:hypothetical protein
MINAIPKVFSPATLLTLSLAISSCSETQFASSENKQVANNLSSNDKPDKEKPDINPDINPDILDSGDDSSTIIPFQETVQVTQGFRILFIQHTSHSLTFPREGPQIKKLLKEVSSTFNFPIAFEYVDHQALKFIDAKNAALVIWDDNSYADKGLTAKNVETFDKIFQAGIPLYLIGDDICFSKNNFAHSSEAVETWQRLTHFNLDEVANGSLNGDVSIVNTNHPILKTPFGNFKDFKYAQDIDTCVSANDGVAVLAKEGSSAALMAYQGPNGGPRSVTQNFMVTGVNESEDQNILFKNTVAWLLEDLIKKYNP